MSAATLPAILRERADATPDGVALRHKRLGIWQELTFRELCERVGRVAAGLAGLGVGAGESVAVLGDATPDWIVTDLAVQALGARTVAPWPRLDAEATLDDLEAARVRVAVCADQEQVDKLAGSDLVVVVVDPTGLGGEGYAHTLAAVEEAGGADAAADAADPGAEASVGYDCGPGREAVVHTAGQLLAAARALVERFAIVEGDRTLAVLAPAALPARVHDVYAALAAGATCHLPESAASVAVDLEEVRPTGLALSPRALELLRASADVRAARSRRFKRRVVEWGRRGGGTGRGVLVRRPRARRMGVGAARHVLAVRGPVSDAMREFFAALGPQVAVLDGPATLAGVGLVDGVSLPGVEARVDDDGRLTARAPWSGRWLAAPAPMPRARLDGERIELLGADDDLVGDTVLPQLEARLRDSPYVTEALVTPGAGGLLAAVGLDVDAVGVWAAEHDVYAATLQGLAEHPAVMELIRGETTRLLGEGTLADVTVLTRRLREEDGELGPLLDVRRGAPA